MQEKFHTIFNTNSFIYHNKNKNKANWTFTKTPLSHQDHRGRENKW